MLLIIIGLKLTTLSYNEGWMRRVAVLGIQHTVMSYFLLNLDQAVHTKYTRFFIIGQSGEQGSLKKFALHL